jgi:hypothetical protein
MTAGLIGRMEGAVRREQRHRRRSRKSWQLGGVNF